MCDEYSCILCWKTLQKHEGTDRNTLLSVIVFVQHWCLFVNLQGAGTNEITLTRVMVSRGEVDMLDIRAEFKKLYQQSLYKEISVSVLHWSLLVHHFRILRFISLIMHSRYHNIHKWGFDIIHSSYLTRTISVSLYSMQMKQILDNEFCIWRYGEWRYSFLFQSDVSGNFGDCLKMICGGED